MGYNRGVYVLHDSKFRPLTHISLDSTSSTPAKEAASLYVMFPCGMLTLIYPFALGYRVAWVLWRARGVCKFGCGKFSGFVSWSACFLVKCLHNLGLIRGVLHSLGVPCQVTADIPALPSTTFTIKIKS